MDGRDSILWFIGFYDMINNLNKNKFSVIDIFAGCGGLGEGFVQVGFDMLAQIEMDSWACETLRTRHLYHELKKRNKLSIYDEYMREKVLREDICSKYPEISSLIDRMVIQEELGKDKIDRIINKIKRNKNISDIKKINVVVGGPPCQAYSLIGRSRDPDRMEKDKRSFLYEYYLNILEGIKPDFFVFENVPGIFTAQSKGKEVFTKMIEDFKNISPSYEIAPSFDEYYSNPSSFLLNSNNFGIPQKRKRVILIGYKKSLLKKNKGIRHIFKSILSIKKRRYTVKDAIIDLPPLKPGEGSNSWFCGYKDEVLNEYQNKMRKRSCGFTNHKARNHMKSDLERYRYFIEHCKNGKGLATLIDLIDDDPGLIPNHKHLDKFIDRFKVQRWDYQSSTITAHISKDGHYYIHPDIKQCRSFTVREAARCQSFPDNYIFEGPRTSQYKQIGNAVPPRLAYEVAKVLKKELEQIYD